MCNLAPFHFICLIFNHLRYLERNHRNLILILYFIIFVTHLTEKYFALRKLLKDFDGRVKKYQQVQMFLLSAELHVVFSNVNSALPRPPYKHKLCPLLLCMKLDSLWDTHPDKRDQCCFIKPCMRSGDGPGGLGCGWSSVSLAWEWEAV